jgi:hypothetical protein
MIKASYFQNTDLEPKVIMLSSSFCLLLALVKESGKWVEVAGRTSLGLPKPSQFLTTSTGYCICKNCKVSEGKRWKVRLKSKVMVRLSTQIHFIF